MYRKTLLDRDKITDGYLYHRMRDDDCTIREYCGELYEPNDSRFGKDHVQFVPIEEKDSKGVYKKAYKCFRKEGLVYNSQYLWLSEPDMERAIGFFIENECDKIAKLYETIEKHEDVIEKLTGLYFR